MTHQQRVPLTAIAAVIFASTPVLADDQQQVGASYLLASASDDPKSAGHSGVALTATTWTGALGGALEIGHQTWSWSSRMWWARAGVRVALLSGSWVCNNRGRCLEGRLWIDAGLARELWTVDLRRPAWDVAGPDISHHARTSGHAGIGIDLQLLGRTGLAVFLRAQHASAPRIDMQTASAMVPLGEDGPYETSLVFGSSMLFDVP
jgi:hypothetical protein